MSLCAAPFCKNESLLASNVCAIHLDHSRAKDEIKHFSPSGASSRSKAPDLSLVPNELEEEALARFEYGINRGHERNNWMKGVDDPAFQIERFLHLFKHARKIRQAIERDPAAAHLGDFQAIICNAAMMAFWRKHGTGFAQAFPFLVEK